MFFPTPKASTGFTLAELLIALAILGVIATFTIPKILTAQQSQQYNAIAKEDASILSGALQQASFQGTLNSGTRLIDLTPYMNYASIDTSGSVIDGIPTVASLTCTASRPCIRLHNGSVMAPFCASGGFTGSTSLHLMEIYVDPNGQQDITSVSDGPGKAVSLVLYYNGFLTSRDLELPSSVQMCGVPSSNAPQYKPSWFNW